ncbi:MAG TPA: polysaccharide biosynthesis/export family protein [Bryobacteraceae bacterium]|jgi:polysaccharide export outer membrane protein|nr:polysaccharide biosynthesis/export family protein [Bryobacteraceae bacterium]
MSRILLLLMVLSTWLSAQERPASSALDTGSANLPALAIGSNDLLAVSVYAAPELTRTVRVGGDGEIRLPMLEQRILARGLMPADLETQIAKALVEENILVGPVVTVTIVEYHSRPISVAGAVRRPITFQAWGKTSLLEALTRAEGLSPEAGAEILITRPAKRGENGQPDQPARLERIAVKGLIEGADPTLNLALEGGEEVRVPQIGRVFVVGNVKHPGAFRIEDGLGMTVFKALALAEGLAPFATKQAFIFRRADGPSPTPSQEVPVELRKILDRKSPDVALTANDILYIPDNRAQRTTSNAIEKAIGFATAVGSGALILGLNR